MSYTRRGGCAADGSTLSFRCAGRATPAPWLPLWGSWHGAAVTERVPSHNHGTFPKFATANALSGSPLARQLSHRESQGRLRRRVRTVLPSMPGGQRPPLGSPYGGAGTAQPGLRGSPVTITGHFPNLQLQTPSQARRWLASSPIGRAKGGCAAEFAPTYPPGWTDVNPQVSNYTSPPMPARCHRI